MARNDNTLANIQHSRRALYEYLGRSVNNLNKGIKR